MLTAKQRLQKRLFDIIVTIVLLPFVLFPLILLLLIATADLKQNGWFVQSRVGRDGALFGLFKIRSLRGGDHQDVLAIKEHETSFGAWIRRTKLDELPQLFNVLLGDMSWVGPRPDVPGYADVLEGEERILLSVRPGITGPATLKYKNEEQLLLQQENPKEYNDQVIWPDKVKINIAYIKNWSLQKDIACLWSSFF